jgi:hypothetical protein
MFDRVTEAAAKLATNVSRRACLGGLGKGALALAGAVGAILTFPGLVQAGGPCLCGGGGQGGPGGWFCIYQCPDGSTLTVPAKPPKCDCSVKYKGCTLQERSCIWET